MDVSEQKYRHLFEAASDAIWLQDVNGLFVDGNQAWQKLTGFTVDEVKGDRVAKYLSPTALFKGREIRYKLITGQTFEQPYEQRIYTKGGAEKLVKMSTNALKTDGKITGFSHVARDITLEKEQQENVRAYIQQITRAQEEERKRISRDLHDDVSPDIIILIQKLDNITSTPKTKLADMRSGLIEVRAQAVKALQGLRATAQGLRPRILDDLGLSAALEWIAEEMEHGQKININVETTGIDRKISSETQILLFRIAQEALNNIRKHAKASNVQITLEGFIDELKMKIKDDGHGFKAPERIEGLVSAGRLGLMGMHERARLLNGDLQIKSAPGEGTEIIVRLPWPEEH